MAPLQPTRFWNSGPKLAWSGVTIETAPTLKNVPFSLGPTHSPQGASKHKACWDTSTVNKLHLDWTSWTKPQIGLSRTQWSETVTSRGDKLLSKHANLSVIIRRKPLNKKSQQQGAVSIRKTVLPGMAIPMLKIRRPNGRLIFNMEIAIRR